MGQGREFGRRLSPQNDRNQQPWIDMGRKLSSPQQEINMHVLRFEVLPPEWAYIEDPRDVYIPICTWSECEQKQIITADSAIHGSPLMLTALLYSDAVECLQEHLQRAHGIDHPVLIDVESMAPYGVVFQIPHRKKPVWE